MVDDLPQNDLVRIEISLTMSSLEVAKLTGKNHKDVLRDIRVMLASIKDAGSAKFFDHYKDIIWRENPCFNLPKRETLIQA